MQCFFATTRGLQVRTSFREEQTADEVAKFL
jgi:hypothetical protein